MNSKRRELLVAWNCLRQKLTLGITKMIFSYIGRIMNNLDDEKFLIENAKVFFKKGFEELTNIQKNIILRQLMDDNPILGRIIWDINWNHIINDNMHRIGNGIINSGKMRSIYVVYIELFGVLSEKKWEITMEIKSKKLDCIDDENHCVFPDKTYYYKIQNETKTLGWLCGGYAPFYQSYRNYQV